MLVGFLMAMSYVALPKRHTLDQCYAAFSRIMPEDYPRYPRIFFGCEDIAENGVADKDVRALRFGGMLNALMMNDAKARYFYETAIRLGDEESKIKMLEMIDGDRYPGHCGEMKRLILSYKPSTRSQEINKAEWIDEIQNADCKT